MLLICIIHKQMLLIYVVHRDPKGKLGKLLLSFVCPTNKLKDYSEKPVNQKSVQGPPNSAGICLFKVTYSVYIVDSEQTLNIALVFLLLTLNKKMGGWKRAKHFGN